MTDDPILAAVGRAKASGDIHAAEVLADAESAPVERDSAPAGPMRWEITDLVSLAQAVVDGTVPGDVLRPNTDRLDEMARGREGPGEANGIRFYYERAKR